MCLAPFAAGSVCECGTGPEQKANIPLEVVELDASGEPLVLSYRGDTNLRFGSILVQLRLTGDATVTATVPGSASNAGYLPPNSAMLTQDAPEAVISPCIEEEFPNSVYDAECPEAFELTLDVAGAEASSAPEVEVEVLTTAVGERCTPKKAAYASFERVSD